MAFGEGLGLKPKVVVLFYRAVLVPRVEYDSVVLWPKTEQISVFKKLENLRGLGLRRQWKPCALQPRHF